MLVSVGTDGLSPANAYSHASAISADGRLVLFRSRASNLATGATGTTDKLFLRDLQAGITYPLTTNAAVTLAAMTADGSVVAYGTGSSIFLWYTPTAQANLYTNNASGLTGLSISPDGIRLAYSTLSQILVSDLNAGQNLVISSFPTPRATNREGLRFSADGRFLTYATTQTKTPVDVNSFADVYVYDFVTGSNNPVTLAYNAPTTGNGASDSPDLSSDGRFVVYRSQATNLVPGDNNGAGDLFLHDRISGSTTLLTVGASGTNSANHWSVNAFFSGNSRTLFLASWASDLVPGNYRQNGDIYALSLPGSGTEPPFNGSLASLNPPVIRFPAITGHGYGVQFKNSLGDPVWQNVNSAAVFIGGQGQVTDPAGLSGSRFYRVVAY